MKRLTDGELLEISLRNHYQNQLGKTLRKYQWDNLKVEIESAYPGEELTKDILTIIAKYKKVSPNWKIDHDGIQLLNENLKDIPRTGLDGATLFNMARKLCRYHVNDRTVRQWFYDVADKCDLSAYYTYQQCVDICIKAMTSKPRAFTK